MVVAQQCKCANTHHSVIVNTNQRKTQLLCVTVILLAGFFVAEWGVGLWSHSLSLQADAGHILTDVAALGISLFASWLAQQPATGKATFGHHRIEIMAALTNGLSLLLIACVIAWEAIHRLQSPEGIFGLPMLAIALLGLAINLINIRIIHPHTHNDLNLRSALLHIIADTASSLGVILAAIAIHLWNWLWADAVVSLLVAGLTVGSALPLVQESLLILLEYAPESIKTSQVETYLQSFPQVLQVEKLHIWRISWDKVILCAHLVVNTTTVEESDDLLNQLQTALRQNFGMTEVTLQLTRQKSMTSVPIHPLFRQDLISILSAKK